MKHLDDVSKIMSEYNSTIKVKCKCGHSIIIPVWVNYRVCSYCGKRIRNNTKAWFKYQFKKKAKEIQDGNSTDNKLGNNSDSSNISI